MIENVQVSENKQLSLLSANEDPPTPDTVNPGAVRILLECILVQTWLRDLIAFSVVKVKELISVVFSIDTARIRVFLSSGFT